MQGGGRPINVGSRQRDARCELAARLRARAPEIEQTILARAYAVSDPTAVGDPEYVAGLRAAVAAALDYGLRGIEGERVSTTSIPPALLSQVRAAARNRVPLDTILRRYVAGHTLLADFVIQEAKANKMSDSEELQRLVRLQAELFDRLVETISAEYRAGVESGARSPQQSRIECARKLLDGRLIDATELGYELGGWHLGLALADADAEPALREIARRHDRRLLLLSQAEGTSWAWLGGAARPSAEELERLLAGPWPEQAHLALGEPGEGLAGWRLSHRQALAALAVARRGPRPQVRYGDVALLASALQDEVLCESLERILLAPLAAERDSGPALCETLRAYFAAQRNVSSAASGLGVTRQTVNNRLRAVEERLELPLSTCAAGLELALRLHDLDRGALMAEAFQP